MSNEPAPARRLRRPGRAPGSANLAAAVAVLAVLLPLLLAAGTSAPPTAAEFSPNADQVIKKAPDGQAAAVNGTGAGQGAGGGGTGGGDAGGGASPVPSASPSPSAPPVENKTVATNLLKRCVGTPPRQIEDPQSPPCIAYFDGENGGATASGVTADAVYIAVPTPESSEAQYDALATFFNDRFQFYGRKLVFQYCASSGGGGGSSDQASQVADAALAAQGCGVGPKPFASTFYRSTNGAYYMPAMCRYKILTMGVYAPNDSKYLDACPGYLFQYPMVADEEFANLGEWGCNRLVGGTAAYSGGNDSKTPPAPLKNRKRKFGVLLEPFTDTDAIARRAALDPLVNRLRACGATLDEQDIIVNPVQGDFDPPSAQNAVLQLRGDDVTSIVCLCNFFSYGTLARAADVNAYQPEWISSTFGLNDVNSSFQLSAAPSTQLQHTFGLTFNPRMTNPLQNPFNVALQEGDPSQPPVTGSTVEAKLEIYRSLLVLAAGIQMAGPDLTPETFRDGLRKTTFPNPITALHAGAVDVRPDGYSYTADGAEWWYSPTAAGPFSDSAATPGTVCYLDSGNRHTLGDWPKGPAPFFTGRCDSGAP